MESDVVCLVESFRKVEEEKKCVGGGRSEVYVVGRHVQVNFLCFVTSVSNLPGLSGKRVLGKIAGFRVEILLRRSGEGVLRPSEVLYYQKAQPLDDV
jgi:hypothetical protein